MTWNHRQSLKEVVRHAFYILGAESLAQKIRGSSFDHLSGDTAERFEAVYATGTWVNLDGQVSRSGLGSELAATGAVRNSLSELLRELNACTLLDVGCGDWNWMSEVSLPCDYVGADIVPSIIEANRKYEKQGVSFILANAVTDTLPEVDVALCREVLFHLSFEDGLAALANIKKTAKYLICTSDASIWFNSNITTGDFRKINLRCSPYRFPPPQKIIRDDAVSPGRVLGVWQSDLL